MPDWLKKAGRVLRAILEVAGAVLLAYLGWQAIRRTAGAPAKTEGEIKKEGQDAYDRTKERLDATPAGAVVDGLANAGEVRDTIASGADRFVDRCRAVVSRLSGQGRAAPGDPDRPGGGQADGGGGGEGGGDAAAG